MQTNFLSCVESRIYDHGQIYARFHLGTFFRGQALTIANALRRTLLGELPGIIITSVEIQGINHEFAILPGIQESILDILLNLKQLVFTTCGPISSENGNQTSFGEPIFEDKLVSQKDVLGSTVNFLEEEHFTNLVFLKIHGPTQVTAADLKLPSHIVCVNPNSHIATLSPTGELALSFQLKLVTPKELSMQKENQTKDKFTKGKIFCLDTVPTPVRKVNYSIYDLNSKKGSEYISLEIWTDGSIHPTQALKFALKKLTKLFFDFTEISQNLSRESK